MTAKIKVLPICHIDAPGLDLLQASGKIFVLSLGFFPARSSACPMASTRSPKFRFAFVVSIFNREYTDALLASAQAALKGHELKIVRVPGAYEIPLQVQRLARTKRFAAII